MNDGSDIQFTTSLDGVSLDNLHGFFEGWPSPPSPRQHGEILQAARHVVLAVEPRVPRVVGFITAIGDGVFTAAIPLLEVLPEYRNRGVASELVRRMMLELDGLYSVDLVCDEHLLGFYQRLGFTPAHAMITRNPRATNHG
ncbi:MAG: GNAT family N-acetyltransferase [Planctomycetota bacterium]